MVLTLKANPREVLGKKIKSLRKEGFLPAVIYGAKEASRPVVLNLKEFEKVWREAGESSLIELELGGEKKGVLIKEVQTDPVKDFPIHADFQAVSMDEKIEAEVPVHFIGESPAVKNFGGVLVKVLHEIEVEALPADLPQSIDVDIFLLENLEQRFLVKDLKLPPRVKVLAEPNEIIALVETPKAEEEVTPETPSLEDIEVVGKKGKKEEEGGEEAESGKTPETKEQKKEPKKESKKESKPGKTE